jgi:hypothetical protein
VAISDIIRYLEELKQRVGDIAVGCDFRTHDCLLSYNEDLNCVFGDYLDDSN